MSENATRQRAGHDAVASAEGFTAALGRQLAQARGDRGWSQRDLAARSGVDQADISRIERGVLTPTTATVGRLLSALGLRLKVEPDVPAAAPPGSTYEDQRPYAIVDDLADLQGPTVGVIELDRRLDWSGRARYDLADRRRLARMYEAVLREASDEQDLARWLNGPALVQLWSSLVLPSRVRHAWEARFPELISGREPAS